jgi:XTP/dITP diphosphohydrolase
MIIIATHNAAKAEEYQRFLAEQKIASRSLADLGVTAEVEETGKTFEENALIKAQFYAKLLNAPVLADDSGLEIDALDGEPGVKSRRWRGYEMTDQELIDYTLERLHGIPPERRTARLKMVLCVVEPGKEPIFAEGAIEGVITEKQAGPRCHGYPFREIFLVKKFNKLYSELTEVEHEKVNHRRKALQNLLIKLSTMAD